MPLADCPTEALLAELLRRHPRHQPSPTNRRVRADREHILPIGRDHHAVVMLWDEAAEALATLTKEP